MHRTRDRKTNRLWLLSLLLVAALASVVGPAPAEDTALIPDVQLPIPKLQFDGAGQLVIEASATSSPHDFDFLVGDWKLRNRKLKSRLTHSNEWTSFESRVEMHQILDGVGNIDKYTDMASGKPYEGVALRLFDTRTKLWSIYWADSNSGSLDPPVVGSFENKVGHFFARVGSDTLGAKPWLYFMMSGGLALAFVIPALWISFSHIRVPTRVALIDAGYWLAAYLTMGLVFLVLG